MSNNAIEKVDGKLKTDGNLIEQTADKSRPVEKKEAGGAEEKRRARKVTPETLANTRKHLEACLAHAEGVRRNRKGWNVFFLVINIVFGLIGGSAAGAATVGGQRLVDLFPAGWQGACAMAAVCTLVVSLCGGLSTVLRVAETMSRAELCVTDLKNLLIDFDDRTPAGAIDAFKKLRKTYSDILSGVK